jgi:hypothetical protein
MTSEEVCEVGKWKNVGAFTSHYLRLGATNKVGSRISDMVHSVSPLCSAESDLTWTTGKNDTVGSVREDEAPSNGETRFISPAVLHNFLQGIVLKNTIPFLLPPSPLTPLVLLIAFLAGGWRIEPRRPQKKHPKKKFKKR